MLRHGNIFRMPVFGGVFFSDIISSHPLSNQISADCLAYDLHTIRR
jgi:hypothetical protein